MDYLTHPEYLKYPRRKQDGGVVYYARAVTYAWKAGVTPYKNVWYYDDQRLRASIKGVLSEIAKREMVGNRIKYVAPDYLLVEAAMVAGFHPEDVLDLMSGRPYVL